MRRTAILCVTSIAALAAAGSASAQSAAPAAEAKASAEDIVVTGSRIARAGFEAPTPVTAMQSDELARKAPGNLADGLNQLPQFQNSISTAQRPTAQGSAQNTGNYLNMRALGPQRVLVLLDGQRLSPSGNNGGVDVSLMPQMLVQRVEVVTGGASAAYGSDAVSGVVNFILNKNLKGLTLTAQRGIQTGGFLPSYRLGASLGLSLFDDRLKVIASAEQYWTDALERLNLPAVGDSYNIVGTGSASSPFTVIRDSRTSVMSANGLVTSGPFNGQQFNSAGQLVSFNPGTPTVSAGIATGGDGAYFAQGPGNTVTSSQLMNQFFVRPELEINDSLKAFVSVGYNTSKYVGNPGGLFRRITTIMNGNAFLRPEVQTALGNTPSFTIGRIFSEGPGKTITQYSDSTLINAGLDGKFGSTNWKIGYTHHWTYFQTKQFDAQNDRYFAALDAVRDPSGNIVCRVTLSNPGLYPGCVPLNPFGVGNASAAAYNYAFTYSQWAARNVMDSVQASASGELFNLPAGPLLFAVGGEHRKVTFNQTSNSDPAMAIDYSALRGVVSSQLLRYGGLNVGIGAGAVKVTEGFVELNAPILKDSAVGSLELNGAARLTNYSTSGSVKTWKAGVLYDPMDGLRIRATLSRDIRAPTPYELFAGQQTISTPYSDPLTGRNDLVQMVSGGNPALKPEIAKTFTAGVILKPGFLPGFQLSADYYSIKVDDAIAAPFTGQQILSICAASNYTSPLCNQVLRPISANNTTPANFPTAVLVNSANLATQTVRGIDVEASYVTNVGAGQIRTRVLATRTLTFDQVNAVGQATRHLVGTADFAAVPLPKLRGSANVTYTNGGFTFGFQERYIGPFNRSNESVYAVNRIPAVFYTDLNISQKIGGVPGDLELFATWNNVFNRLPPIAPASNTPGIGAPYYVNVHDVIGSYLTAGAKLKF